MEQPCSHDRRSDKLISKFREILKSKNVYFQPPSDVHLCYPCIVFYRDGAYNPSANDRGYLFQPSYKVTYINNYEPDPGIIRVILDTFMHSKYTGHSVIGNLHHDYFTIYF